jgi:hypothetical protein
MLAQLALKINANILIISCFCRGIVCPFGGFFTFYQRFEIESKYSFNKNPKKSQLEIECY